MKSQELISEEGGPRLDAFLAQRLTGYSRVFLKGLIGRGCVTVGGQARDASYHLKPGEAVRVDWPEAPPAGRNSLEGCVVYEDPQLLVLDKPPGLVMHPAGTSWLTRPEASLSETEPTVVSLLLGFRPKLAALPRTGLVHRLDRQTSGVLLIAKTADAQEALMQAFRDRTIGKTYRAVVVGRVVRDEGVIDAPIGRKGRKTEVSDIGREAVTEYTVLERAPKATLLEARPLTGRTHQIRAHLALAGHPVAGDDDFPGHGVPKPPRMMLHAWRIEFDHPRTGRPVTMTAPVPDDLTSYWKALKGAGGKKKK